MSDDRQVPEASIVYAVERSGCTIYRVEVVARSEAEALDLAKGLSPDSEAWAMVWADRAEYEVAV